MMDVPNEQDVESQYTSREWRKQVKIVIHIIPSHPDFLQIHPPK